MRNGQTKNDNSGNCAAENEKANVSKENVSAFCKKPLGKQLRGQFFYKNIPIFCLAVFAALAAGSLNLILSWIIQQLMDTAAGFPAARNKESPLRGVCSKNPPFCLRMR